MQLDLARANTALRKLVREHATTPTFGSFFEMYRSLDTRRPPEDNEATCEACDGTGWVEAPPLVRNVAGQPHEYSQMRPCPGCAEGAARERSTIWRERNR